MSRKTVAIDFDGVIHAYSKGWHDGSAYDEPLKGAFDAIETLAKKYSVYVFTTRDLEQVQDWFARHKFSMPTEIVKDDRLFYEGEDIIGLSNRKIVAYVWVDDRALRFEGEWHDTMKQIKELMSKDEKK